jgi:hypothetical protein
MPVTTGGYGSLYSGDVHAMSNSHHEGLSRPADEYRTSAVPVTANTYAVRKEPLSRSTSVNDGTRAHRVADHTNKRPIIVTTKHHPPGPRAGSPSRDPYRSSDEGQYYAEPASSIPRSRAAGQPPSTTAMDEEEYRRLKDRTHHDRLGNRGADPYRPPRPGPLYAGPNHRPNNAFEFNDEGYEYTKPSDLARYDLDHDRRPKPRRETLDRYYRPTVSISTDLARPFDQTDRRARGPPPTTRGLDKVAWAAGGIYDGAGSRMPLPSAAPLAPDVRRPNLLETPGSPRGELRGGPRPLSMIQDDPGRHDHFVEPYYYYEDGHPKESELDHDRFQDDRVTSRGFGILVDPNDVEEQRPPPEKVYRDERRERREPPKRYDVHEPRRRSDDDVEITHPEVLRGTFRHDDRDRKKFHDPEDFSRDALERDARSQRPNRDDDEPDSKKDKARDKVAAGLGLAAASIGLGAAARGKDDKHHDDPSPSRRYRDEEPEYRRPDEAEHRGGRPSRKEALLDDEDFEIVELPNDRERPRNGKAPEPGVRESRENGNAATSPRDDSSSTDEGRSKPRRRPRASFNPNDTAALAEMKARLAELKAKDGSAADDKDRHTGKDTREPGPDRRPSPDDKDPDAAAVVPRKDDDDRDPERQVRVVPPPKDAFPTDKKPIKGILKQPRAQFPEPPNPVREGVAPHKDDKSKTDVPPGARWTKISRKMVNPEALKIGKERFEVRDDFVIVLRVLSKEEIQGYAAATAQLRGMYPPPPWFYAA